MKRSSIIILLTMLMSMVNTKASAHDIEVKNTDGVTIYYVWTNEGQDLSVSYKGTSSSSKAYTGKVVIPESVVYEGNIYNVTSIGDIAFEYCSGLTSV